MSNLDPQEVRDFVLDRLNELVADPLIRLDVERLMAVRILASSSSAQSAKGDQLMTDLGSSPQDKMVWLPDGKNFRCDCGCNVFRNSKGEDFTYICNSCGTRWKGEPREPRR